MQPPNSSEEVLASYSLRSKESKCDKTGMEPGTSYEVFRNNTTAIEVIVKEVPSNKFKKTRDAPSHIQEAAIKKLQKDIDSLKIELNHANSRLLTTRNGFKNLIFEMKTQLEAAGQRETERQTQNLQLELENEKLKTLLSSKSNLVAKMKRELLNMKGVLKFVIKSIVVTPKMPENVTFNSDPEYDDFEKELKRNTTKFPFSVFDGAGMTFDSTRSKD